MAMIGLLALCNDGRVVGLEIIDFVFRNNSLGGLLRPVSSGVISQINQGVPVDMAFRIQFGGSSKPIGMLYDVQCPWILRTRTLRVSHPNAKLHIMAVQVLLDGFMPVRKTLRVPVP